MAVLDFATCHRPFFLPTAPGPMVNPWLLGRAINFSMLAH
jgi:hypothetical protein